MKERNLSIDLLRGFSIFAMILIHTNAYFLHKKTAYLLWDLSQFAVPAFIFCSSYLFFQREFVFTTASLLTYAKKRVLRLIIPYYLFLIPLLLLTYFAEPGKITARSILEHITLTGGVDINWLILLFLTFTLIMPWLHHSWKKRSTLLPLFAVLSTSTTVLLLFVSFPFSYKWIMWFPWSLIILFTIYVVSYEKKSWFYPVTLGGTLLVFLATRFLQLQLGHSVIQYYNKYPPNLLHLSYGMFTTTLLYFLFQKQIFHITPFKQLLVFLSTYSYSIYFVHFLLIFYVTVSWKQIEFTWQKLFIVILALTILTQCTINGVRYLFSALKRGPTI